MKESINSHWTGLLRETQDLGLRMNGLALWTKELGKAATEQ